MNKIVFEKADEQGIVRLKCRNCGEEIRFKEKDILYVFWIRCPKCRKVSRLCSDALANYEHYWLQAMGER